MWCPLFLALLVGAASAEHFQAWKTDTEYKYAIRGRTLSALHDVADQYSGIVLRALLTIQPKSEGTLEAKVTKAKFAQVHTKLPGGWSSEIPENMLELKQFPMSEKVFEIKMKHGVVRDLIVDKDVPNWEVNVLKSIVSQLQVDTQGENMMSSRMNQEPEVDRISAVYKTMEDSVGGKCEVLYDISPFPEFVLQSRPELMPMPEVRGEGEIIDIVKTKNYSNCEQRSGYHFGITGSNNWEPGASDNGNFLSRSSMTRTIITGDLKTFTIQSSVTTNKIVLSPNFYENRKGMVSSRVNLTLVRMGPLSSEAWSTPANPESTGNLVYSYNNPFAGASEGRRAGKPREENLNSDEQWRERRNRYWRHKGQQQDDDDDLNTSDFSKSANSFESDEEQSYLQPLPTLNKAPAIPLLPFFIGDRGKSIEKSEQVDLVVSAKSLSSQIGSELQNPTSITKEQTLEKFTILVRIIRMMDTRQITEAQRELYQSANELDPNDESNSVRRSTWVAFRDAVAQAGTGPALVVIKNWIKEKKIRGFEAASLVGVLSKTARTPTQEYMDTFFELATMPETTEEQFLNSTALITFAELIRLSQNNDANSHNRYPVHTFGRFTARNNPAMLRDYVPYMAEKLKNCIEKKENAKSHTFITALGNIAHPKILAIFEPYLEGKIPASTFQRLLMVTSLDKLAALKPTLARSVLYRIYQNSGESHQLRCAAVILLMTTNPPASILQRMAEFTNDDHSKHVNAVVKSTIEWASELETPESSELAKNARNVKSLLKKESYGFEYSKNYLTDFIDREMNLAYRAQSSYVSSDDSFMPETYLTSMETIIGGFKMPRLNAVAMVSSFKDLSNLLKTLMKSQKKIRENSKLQFTPEKIAKLLKMEMEPTDSTEGIFKIESPFDNRFMSFDKSSLQRLPELIKHAVATLKDGQNFNIAKIESVDVTVSFPTESGFPFVYTMTAPMMLKMSGSAKGNYEEESRKGSVELRAVLSTQIQAKLGFVTPFEHQHYMAGINKNYQINVPIRAQFQYEKSEKRVTLKIQPIEQNEKHKFLYHSVVPFTSRHNILDLRPVTKDQETHKLTPSDVRKEQFTVGSRTQGIYVKVESEGAYSMMSNPADSFWKSNPLASLARLFVEKPKYHKIEVSMEPNQSSEQSIILSASLESLRDDATAYDENRSKNINAKAPQFKSKKQNDPTRRRELLQEAAKGIAAADAFAVDIGLELPGQEPLKTFATVAYATSKVDEKSRGLVTLKLMNARSQLELETCVGLESRSPRSSDIDSDFSDKLESPSRSRKFDVDIRFGKTCENGKKIEIKGSQEQSEQFRDAIKDLPTTIECMKASRKGRKSSPACQDVSVRMSTLDKTRVTINFDEAARGLRHKIDSYLDDMTDLADGVKFVRKSDKNDDKSEKKNSVELFMKLYPNKNKASFSYESDDVRFIADDVNVNGIGALATNVNPDLTSADLLAIDLSAKRSHQRMCEFDSNSATTFDASTIPIDLGKCWHVAMMTFPKTSKDSRATEKINEDMAVSILIRDTGNNKKDVKVTLDDKEIHLRNDGSKNQVKLDGRNVDLAEKRSYKQRTGKEIDFELLQSSDGSLWLTSSKFGIDLRYNGERVQIKASNKYRNDVRGLCGNFDGEPANDWASPKDCVLSKPEEFAASYALTTEDCQGRARELARKAEEAVCSTKSPRPGNVVSDREGGRSNSENSNWGHHIKNRDDDMDITKASSNHKRCTTVRTKVIEETDQTCFSLRPIPTCVTDCKPSRTKPKAMPMFCMPKSEASQRMAERIKKGANPDLSQKELSKKSTFDIPVSCHAA